MSTATEVVSEGLQSIALASINPNPDNPRKHYDDQALKDLAASIRAQGVWEPIVVRPDPIKPKTYELVIGERRWRAAKLAGLTAIPAIVRQLSDREALEAMVLENLQREDLDPLDEAAGYRALLDYGADKTKPSHTITSLAERIGKSESYVHARLKLLQLIPAARIALARHFITPGHAVLIARLQPPEQLRALRACWNVFDDDKKVDAQEVKLADIIALDVEFHLLAEKGLRTWIQDNVNLKLKGVPWDVEDAALVVEAGACSTCPKNSLVNPLLFSLLAGKNDAVCFDPACYQAKRQALVKLQFQTDRDQARAAAATGEEHQALRPLSEQRTWTAAVPDQKTLKAGQWLPAKKGECASVEKGVITKGEHAGETQFICANAACKVHKHNLEKAPQAPARPETEDSAKREAEEKLQEALNKHLSGILRKSVDGADRAALMLIGEIVIEEYFFSIEQFYTSGRKTEARFREELHDRPLAKAWSHLVEYLIFHFNGEESHAGSLVQVYVQAQKLDLKKAESDFRKAYKAEAAKKEAAKEPKKGVSSKKAGGTGRPSGSPR